MTFVPITQSAMSTNSCKALLTLATRCQYSEALVANCDDIVEGWLEPAKAVLASINSQILHPLWPDWNILSNVVLLFKAKARRLAILPGVSGEASSALNAFGNSPPLVFRKDRYRFCYDRLTSRIPMFTRDLEVFRDRGPLSILVTSPGDGLCTCWLMEKLFSSKKGCSLFCLDPSPKLTWEGALLLDNFTNCKGDRRIYLLRTPSPFLCSPLTNTLFDFVYFARRSRSHFVFSHVASAAWQRLRSGGVMMFDDYLMHANPLDAILFQYFPKHDIDGFLSSIDGQYDCITDAYWITISKK